MKCLAIVQPKSSTEVKDLKIKAAKIAIGWPGDTTEGKFIYHWLWTSPDGQYKVGVGKFGKEYYELRDDGSRKNINDMRPVIFKNGKEVVFDGSFKHVFKFMEYVYDIDKEVLKVIGCLLYRASIMEDHTLDENHDVLHIGYEYNPPQEAIDYINSKIPLYESLPVEVFLHYLH